MRCTTPSARKGRAVANWSAAKKATTSVRGVRGVLEPSDADATAHVTKRRPSRTRRAWRLGALPFIAEDLGLITPDVHALRDQFAVPGTRVLQFAFDGHPDNPHLPDNYVPNAVAYTGTHDGRARHGSASGPPQPREGSPDERSRPGGG